jgi:hypothetical protein
VSRPTVAPTPHVDWCDGTHTRDGLKRCSKRIGTIRGVHVYVSVAAGGLPQVLVDSNGALSRLSVEDAEVLHGLIGTAIRVARGELVEDSAESVDQ